MCDMPGGAGRAAGAGPRVPSSACSAAVLQQRACSGHVAPGHQHCSPPHCETQLVTCHQALLAHLLLLLYLYVDNNTNNSTFFVTIYHLTSCLYYQLTHSFTIDTGKDIQYIFYSMLVKPATGSPGVCRWLCARWWRTPTRRPCP